MKRTIPVFAVLAAIALALPASHAQTLTGAQAQGEARRKQIEKVEVKGDHAVLEARDGPNVVTVQHFLNTKDGWKVHVRP